MENVDIFNKPVRLKAALRRLKKSKISKRNKKLISEYVTFITGRDLLEPTTQVRHYDNLRLIAEYLRKDFIKMTKRDSDRVIQHTNGHGHKTITSYRSSFKNFIKWVQTEYNGFDDKGNDRLFPEIVSRIKVKIKKKKHRNSLRSEHILIKEEIMRMIGAEKSIYWRAFEMVLWESGCRTTEMFNIRVADLELTDKGIDLTIREGKTGSRVLPLVKCKDALLAWIKTSMGNPNEIVFPRPYISSQQHIQALGKSVGITKKCGLKWFRKAAATYYSQFMTAAELKYWFGWSRLETAEYYIRTSPEMVRKKIHSIHDIHDTIIRHEKQQDNKLRNMIQEELRTLLKIDQSKVGPILKALDYKDQDQFNRLVSV